MFNKLQTYIIQGLNDLLLPVGIPILCCLLGGWLGFRLGLHSQQHIARREAKLNSLAAIDRIALGGLADSLTPEDAASRHTNLGDLVLQFSVRLSNRQRNSIQGAWHTYDQEAHKQANPMLSMESLFALRESIKRA